MHNRVCNEIEMTKEKTLTHFPSPFPEPFFLHRGVPAPGATDSQLPECRLPVLDRQPEVQHHVQEVRGNVVDL